MGIVPSKYPLLKSNTQKKQSIQKRITKRKSSSKNIKKTIHTKKTKECD